MAVSGDSPTPAEVRARGIILGDTNSLRINPDNCLRITPDNSVRIPADDFAVADRLAREAMTLEALRRMERLDRQPAPSSYSERFRAGARKG